MRGNFTDKLQPTALWEVPLYKSFLTTVIVPLNDHADINNSMREINDTKYV